MVCFVKNLSAPHTQQHSIQRRLERIRDLPHSLVIRKLCLTQIQLLRPEGGSGEHSCSAQAGVEGLLGCGQHGPLVVVEEALSASSTPVGLHVVHERSSASDIEREPWPSKSIHSERLTSVHWA